MSYIFFTVLLLALAWQTSYAAERVSLPQPVVALATRTEANRSVPIITMSTGGASAQPGGRIKFVGAIMVGTAATPFISTTAGGTGALAIVQTGHLASPARVVVVRPFVPQEQSSQLKLLELPNERIGRLKEVVVTYM